MKPLEFISPTLMGKFIVPGPSEWRDFVLSEQAFLGIYIPQDKDWFIPFCKSCQVQFDDLELSFIFRRQAIYSSNFDEDIVFIVTDCINMLDGRLPDDIIQNGLDALSRLARVDDVTGGWFAAFSRYFIENDDDRFIDVHQKVLELIPLSSTFETGILLYARVIADDESVAAIYKILSRRNNIYCASIEVLTNAYNTCSHWCPQLLAEVNISHPYTVGNVLCAFPDCYVELNRCTPYCALCILTATKFAIIKGSALIHEVHLMAGLLYTAKFPELNEIIGYEAVHKLLNDCPLAVSNLLLIDSLESAYKCARDEGRNYVAVKHLVQTLLQSTNVQEWLGISEYQFDMLLESCKELHVEPLN